MTNNKPCVYVITNIINGKRYIGVTCFNTAKRWKEHINRAVCGVDTRLYRAMRKYGRECFKIEILTECSSKEEAFDLEIALISLIQPEYNISKGGGGRRSPLTPAGRLALSQKHKGNKYCLGKVHSQKTKDKIAQAQFNPAIIAAWAERRKLGPAAFARSVRCETDGLKFKSASEAARHYGLAKSAIIELCLGKRGRKTVGGRVFKYMDLTDAT